MLELGRELLPDHGLFLGLVVHALVHVSAVRLPSNHGLANSLQRDFVGRQQLVVAVGSNIEPVVVVALLGVRLFGYIPR